MTRKYTKSKALISSFSGKLIASYLGGARFKSYLHPSIRTQCHYALGLFIIDLFSFLQVFVKCVCILTF